MALAHQRRAVAVLLGLAGLALLALAGCHGSRPIRLGVILAETGPADYVGSAQRPVLEAMVKEYKENNGPSIELVIRNSGTNPQKALSIFNDFAKDPRIVAVIGPSTSGESIIVAQRADELKVPLLSLGAASAIVTDASGKARPWAYKFALTDSLQAAELARTMAAKGHVTVAMLYSDDGFGQAGLSSFKASAQDNRKVKLVFEKAFPPELSDPRPIVADIPPSANAVLIWGTSGTSELVKALKDRASQAQVYLSSGSSAFEFIDAAGAAADGAIVVGSPVMLAPEYLDPIAPRDAVALEYRKFWERHFQGRPSQYGGTARDALSALALTLRDSLPNNRKGIRDGLERLKSLPGVRSTITFSAKDHDGQTPASVEVYRIQKGAFVPLEGIRRGATSANG